MVWDYKDCCRWHKGSWLCTKDWFEVWFRTEQECIDYIKRFKEYMEKKKTH